MAQEGIHYVVGPNVDDGAAAVRPVAEKAGIIYFPYAFPKELYAKPASNAVLGMVASYQSGPAIYKYLKDNKGVKTIAFVAANESDPLSQRDSGVAAAKALGLKVVADKDTYQNDTRDFTPVLTPIVKLKPDLLVLSGVAPGNAPLLIRSARELGYKGLISTETAQDAKVLQEGAGELANGFISVGGASTPEIRSPMMEEFIDRYTKKFGEYNDESNTKVYALEYILDTLKANPKAIDNVEEFKKTIDTVLGREPLHERRQQAEICRHDLVRPEAAGRRPDGGERIRRRHLQDPVRRRSGLSAVFMRWISAGRSGGPPTVGSSMEQVIANGVYLGAQYASDRAGVDPHLRLDERSEFCARADVRARRFITYEVYGKLGLPFALALLASGLTLAIVGALVEKFLFRTVIKRSVREESTMLLAAAVAFFFDAMILLLFGEKQRGVPKIVNGIFVSDALIMPYDRLLVGALAILFITAFMLYMQYSRPGRAMRALAQDRVAAQLMGVRVDRYSMIGFALGAMLAGVVGGLLVAITGVNAGIGGPISLKAFLMVMIGGAGVVGGAIAGGFILGMLEFVGLSVLHAYGDITYLGHLRRSYGVPEHSPQRAHGQALGMTTCRWSRKSSASQPSS